MTKKTEATAVAPTRAELMAKMMEALTPEQKAAMYPPIEPRRGARLDETKARDTTVLGEERLLVPKY